MRNLVKKRKNGKKKKVLKKNRKWIKKIISMSNRMKMMVRKKNWRDRGIRTFLKFSIPHSKGRIFSFKKYLKSLSKNITAKKIKKTILEMVKMVKEKIIGGWRV
mgnify:CR=1 FL=1|jgi:hypothetical protein